MFEFLEAIVEPTYDCYQGSRVVVRWACLIVIPQHFKFWQAQFSVPTYQLWTYLRFSCV